MKLSNMVLTVPGFVRRVDFQWTSGITSEVQHGDFVKRGQTLCHFHISAGRFIKQFKLPIKSPVNGRIIEYYVGKPMGPIVADKFAKIQLAANENVLSTASSVFSDFREIIMKGQKRWKYIFYGDIDFETIDTFTRELTEQELFPREATNEEKKIIEIINRTSYFP